MCVNLFENSKVRLRDVLFCLLNTRAVCPVNVNSRFERWLWTFVCLVQIHTFDSSRVGFQLGESFTLSMVSFQSSCGLISNVHCEKNQMIDTSLLFLINGLNVYLAFFYCHLKGILFQEELPPVWKSSSWVFLCMRFGPCLPDSPSPWSSPPPGPVQTAYPSSHWLSSGTHGPKIAWQQNENISF